MDKYKKFYARKIFFKKIILNMRFWIIYILVQISFLGGLLRHGGWQFSASPFPSHIIKKLPMALISRLFQVFFQISRPFTWLEHRLKEPRLIEKQSTFKSQKSKLENRISGLTKYQHKSLIHLFILKIQPILESHNQSGHEHFWPLPTRNYWSDF